MEKVGKIEKLTFQAKRPPLLGAVLDITHEMEDIDREMFTTFLEIATTVEEQAAQSRISINGSVEYSISTKLLHQEGRVEEEKSNGTNSSLLDIFQYYAALEPPNALQAKTFSDVLETNDTMELVEFNTFLRDFQVVPRLLTKKEVREVWNSICADYVAAGHGTFKKMDFEVFRDAILRLAVCAFCKTGLRNMITKVNGFSINGRHAVDYLCKYLHLEDLQWVRRHISIVGKESQGARNYRSNGEVDEQAMAHLAEEREVTRLLHRGMMSAELKQRKKKKSVLRKSAPKSFHESIAESVHTSPSTSRLPESLKQQMYPEFFAHGGYLPPPSPIDGDADFQRSVDDSHMPSIEDANTMLTAHTSAAAADSCDKLLKTYYDSSMGKMLARYCVAQEHQITTRYIYSEGGFVDMGIVPSGAKCKVRFFVNNKSRDGLYFDVMARDLQCDDVCVRTHAAMLVPGLQRIIDVSFTIPQGHKSVIGFVDLLYLAPGSTVQAVLSCPIYYRIGVPSAKTRNICTIHTIEALKRQYRKTDKPVPRISHLTCTLPEPSTRRSSSNMGSARIHIPDKPHASVAVPMAVAGTGGVAAMALRAVKESCES